jgi:nucleoside-diphosphate-sugar epimerase
MNILVIGGSGLFGRKTIIHLLQDPEVSTVVSMDKTPPKEWFLRAIEQSGSRFKFVYGDLSQLEDILNIMKTYSIQKLVNFAFLIGADADNNPRLATRVNALGMCNCFEAARLMGASRVVYASSETVYGTQNEYGDREVTEDDRLYPSHSYGITKRFAEILAGQYSQLYGLSLTALRPTIGYGHGGQMPPIVKWLSDMISLPAIGKPVSYETDGTGLRSLVAADDVGKFTAILLRAPSSKYPAYNVGGPPYSLRDVAEQVKKFIPDAKIQFGDQKPQGKPGEFGLPWKVSNARARDEFGFTPLPLEEAVLRHINDARFEAGMEPLKV